MQGIIKAVCISKKRGTVKENIREANLIEDFGIEQDAHAGKWHRQVSLLSYQKVEDFNDKGGDVGDGDFGENLLVDGIDLRLLPVGTKLSVGEVELEVTQIGKKCHQHCEIFHRVGDCIMPREGIFTKVLTGGHVQEGDVIKVDESSVIPVV